MERREVLAVVLALAGFLVLLPLAIIVPLLVMFGAGPLRLAGLGLLLIPPVLCVGLIVTARRLVHPADGYWPTVGPE